MASNRAGGIDFQPMLSTAPVGVGTKLHSRAGIVLIAALSLMLTIAGIAATAVAWAAETTASSGGQDKEKVLLRFGGDEILATTIVVPLARDYLERKGVQRINVVDAPAPWTKKINGRMANGDRVSILVRSASTADGFLLLNRGEIDIAMAGREITREELQAMPVLGSHGEPSPLAAIARAAAVITVHPSNPIETLTPEQLHGIYAGTITDW